MAARKREKGESFEQYRHNLKVEARAIKALLKGRYLFVSKQVVGKGMYAVVGEGKTAVKKYREGDSGLFDYVAA